MDGSEWKQGGDRVASKFRVAAAWLAMLAASSFGLILYRVLLGSDPPSWLGFVNVTILSLLLALGHAITSWRSLRGYFLALIAFAAGNLVADHVAGAGTWQGWVAHMFANALIQVIPCALLALSLVGSGLTRRDVFLSKGDMAARTRMPRWLPPVSWARLGPFLTLFLAGGLAVQLTFTVRPDLHMLGRAVLALPLALAFAAINAAQEEFRFRVVLLARLLPAVGTTHALLATSLLFGLDHWFGHPSGPSGVLLAGFAGYLWGKSMVETRGSAWAWLMHGFQDVVIFTFLVAANG